MQYEAFIPKATIQVFLFGNEFLHIPSMLFSFKFQSQIFIFFFFKVMILLFYSGVSQCSTYGGWFYEILDEVSMMTGC